MIRSLKNELAAAKSELRQSREVIRNTKNALLDSALNQLNVIKKLESLKWLILYIQSMVSPLYVLYSMRMVGVNLVVTYCYANNNFLEVSMHLGSLVLYIEAA